MAEMTTLTREAQNELDSLLKDSLIKNTHQAKFFSLNNQDEIGKGYLLDFLKLMYSDEYSEYCTVTAQDIVRGSGSTSERSQKFIDGLTEIALKYESFLLSRMVLRMLRAFDKLLWVDDMPRLDSKSQELVELYALKGEE